MKREQVKWEGNGKTLMYWCGLVKQCHWVVWSDVAPLGCHEVMMMAWTGATMVVVHLSPVMDVQLVLQHDEWSVELGDCESW
jgi:hypothetical protein